MRVFVLAIALAAAACGPKPEVIEPPAAPPLPPSSGTAVGYLVDAQGELALHDDQLAKLQRLDESLAAENGSIDAQLRQIEKPVPAADLSPQQQKAGVIEPRYNNAPGASTVTTDDSQKLRTMRNENEQRALEKAFELLDETQRETATRILHERGIKAPASQPSQASHGSALPAP